MQVTIKKEIKAKGVGVHYNKLCDLTLKPAPVGTGILFKRTDVMDKRNEILAHFKNIDSMSLSTRIKNEDGVFVATIEHLLSAIFAFGITNIIIEVNSPEMPIMEGGAEDFCFMLECVGRLVQEKTHTKFKLLKEIKVGDDSSYIIAKPTQEFKVEFVSNFSSKDIGEQKFVYNKKVDFVKDIASARTIANLKEVEMLQKAGLGLGGSLKNTLVYDEERVLNEPCLFNKDDFVKHKVLDFLGDISLAGGEIIADFSCFKSGHRLNHQILQEIFKDEANYQLI
jgi:UDP-3-O-[3-hydroxymyristoyl] N-acetylglucosamine deacetylase